MSITNPTLILSFSEYWVVSAYNSIGFKITYENLPGKGHQMNWNTDFDDYVGVWLPECVLTFQLCMLKLVRE